MTENVDMQGWTYRWIKGSSGHRDLDTVVFFNPKLNKNTLFTFADLEEYVTEGRQNFMVAIPNRIMQVALDEYYAEEQQDAQEVA